MNCKLKEIEFKMKNLSALIDSVAIQGFLIWGQHVPREGGDLYLFSTK